MAMDPNAQAAMAAMAAQAVSQQRSFIIDSFRGQIIISDQMDVQDTPLYDTVTYAAGDTAATLFTGGTGPTTTVTWRCK